MCAGMDWSVLLRKDGIDAERGSIEPATCPSNLAVPRCCEVLAGCSNPHQALQFTA